MGLDYIHRICGIIHTDLKPENVMLTEALRPRPQHQAAPVAVPRNAPASQACAGCDSIACVAHVGTAQAFPTCAFARHEAQNRIVGYACLATTNR
jgi:serine/threonine protein kinase